LTRWANDAGTLLAGPLRVEDLPHRGLF